MINYNTFPPEKLIPELHIRDSQIEDLEKQVDDLKAEIKMLERIQAATRGLHMGMYEAALLDKLVSENKELRKIRVDNRETPETYKIRTGKDYPADAPVYFYIGGWKLKYWYEKCYFPQAPVIIATELGIPNK